MKEPLIPQGRKESISSDRKSSVISRITIQGDIDLFEAIENQNKEGIIKYLSYHPEAKITNFLEDEQYTILHRIAFQTIKPHKF